VDIDKHAERLFVARLRDVELGMGNDALATRTRWGTIGHWARLQPQYPCGYGRINAALPPPRGFVAAAVNLAMMSAAEWHSELVTGLSPQCATLREAKVVGIGGLSTANQARALGNEFDVISIANPARFRQRQ